LCQRPFAAAQGDMRKWFVGQVARATRGKADMNVAKELLVKALDGKRK
jgi:Asp-tRNA(Asn)/Glu-tRNA(Gln) amidotransferase B subunit